MDMRQYASKYIKPDQVRDGPIQSRIVKVFDGNYGPVIELDSGSQFPLNEGNRMTLMKAWGFDSDDWVGQELILELGTYKDWKTEPPEEKETVKARAISPAKTAEAQNGGAPASKPLPPSRVVTPTKDDMNDSIPF